MSDMPDGNSISATTARIRRDENIGLLTAKPARPGRAPKKTAQRGSEVVSTDGTPIPTQRRTGVANRPDHSREHHRHGLHVLALTDERGRMIWISADRPGRTHDIAAARRDHLFARLLPPVSPP
ncbi:transposase family protein [Streptomyces sp. MMG1121]|uniref:transposase family protein n=1 Tax=Streptomyces sp. MMG1121 TaxID=1415544 RepID=UPI0006ADBF80|nr:transposase family protein [Streptomyces sp. MMG1121]KOV61265.1 hypothetical protein ADK64_28435 [Streptomyces sp. MMG1121]